MVNREHILEQALSLPPVDRAFIADALERSLATGDFASPEIAEAWAQEIERRLAAYDRGEIKAVEGTSLARLRERLRALRKA
jgi:putative addiction module component (TIGR02574 family)